MLKPILLVEDNPHDLELTLQQTAAIADAVTIPAAPTATRRCCCSISSCRKSMDWKS